VRRGPHRADPRPDQHRFRDCDRHPLTHNDRRAIGDRHGNRCAVVYFRPNGDANPIARAHAGRDLDPGTADAQSRAGWTRNAGRRDRAGDARSLAAGSRRGRVGAVGGHCVGRAMFNRAANGRLTSQLRHNILHHTE